MDRQLPKKGNAMATTRKTNTDSTLVEELIEGTSTEKRKSGRATPKYARSGEKIKNLNIKIPESLQMKFSLCCKLRNTTATDRIYEMIEDEINANQKELNAMLAKMMS
jgi:hypothetical protein